MVAAALVGIGFKLLPNDQKAIHKLMAHLAEAASVHPGDSSLARLAYADRLAGFFTTNAVLHLEALNADFPAVSSRSELIEAAMAARAHLRQADFRLADLDVKFLAEKGTAHAYVVITGQINHQTNQFGQAFHMNLQKAHGHWLISEVQAIEHLQ